MAKKFVRGVTGVDNIESFDKTLTNVNDLISDGQNTYVHTKKGKNESYYNLTNSLKSVVSDNSDLITVAKDNTTNTATIQPKHDAQKEQSLESTRNTITLQKGSNGTTTTTKVDTNPKKVLEHDNLLTDYGIRKTTSENITKLGIEYKIVSDGFDLNGLQNGRVRAGNLLNAPKSNTWYFVSAFTEGSFTIQDAITLVGNNNKTFRRLKSDVGWGPWREQVGDKSDIDDLLAQKQNKVQNTPSIGLLDTGLQQLYTLKQIYSVSGGLLKTHVKSISQNTSVSTTEEEFNFVVKINKGVPSVNFTLNTHNTTKFANIMKSYGENNTVNISGCVFTLNGSTLTVSTTNNTNQNYVVDFSDII